MYPFPRLIPAEGFSEPIILMQVRYPNPSRLDLGSSTTVPKERHLLDLLVK
jgi:hypothetical protein